MNSYISSHTKLILETEHFPKTTPKRCLSCDDSHIGSNPLVTPNQHTCAESTIDTSTYDVCGGDSGGKLKRM